MFSSKNQMFGWRLKVGIFHVLERSFGIKITVSLKLIIR